MMNLILIKWGIMKRGSTLLLRTAIVIIGLIVLVLATLGLPQGIITDKTGLYRPILIGMYAPAIPFFFALYQAMKLLNYIDKNQAFSDLSVKALSNIKYCAFTISALYAAGMPYIFYVADLDDAPGVAAIGFIIIFASFVIGVAAALFESLLKNVVEIKKENDLTV
jgi:hypothetical protein